MRLVVCLLAVVLACPAVQAADVYGLTKGNPEIQSADVLGFGPDGILFIGDTKSAAIFAVATGETSGDPSAASYDIPGLNVKIAQALGAASDAVAVTDVAVNPLSGSLFVSVSQGDAGPALVRVGSDGAIAEFSLEGVSFAEADLPNPPADAEVGEGRRRRNLRGEAITDLAYAESQLLISGVNADGKSTVWTFAFPFSKFDAGASLEIFHGAHGRDEDSTAMRTFVPFTIGGKPHLLASYTCTPLVKFPLSDLESGAEVKGTTVAELGNRNRPIDMIVYEKGGDTYLMLINSARGTMKISTNDIERDEGITQPVSGGGLAGQTYDTIEDLAGAVQLAKLNDSHAVILIQNVRGELDLRTVELP